MANADAGEDPRVEGSEDPGRLGECHAWTSWVGGVPHRAASGRTGVLSAALGRKERLCNGCTWGSPETNLLTQDSACCHLAGPTWSQRKVVWLPTS